MQLQIISGRVNDDYLNSFYLELHKLYNESKFEDFIHTIHFTRKNDFKSVFEKYDILIELYDNYKLSMINEHDADTEEERVFFVYGVIKNYEKEYFRLLRKHKLKKLLNG